MKKLIYTILLLIIIASCAKKSEPRKPISQSSGSFMKESVERNKKIVASEELILRDIIKKDTANVYKNSEKGYWYTLLEKGKDSIKAIKGDLLSFEYEVQDVKGNSIYSLDEIGPQKYLVDKETIIKGFQDGLKRLHKGDKAKFLFPSNLAYGYNGDQDKITGNQPIICIVKINELKQQTK